LKHYTKRKGSPPCRTAEQKKRYDKWYYRNVTCKGK